eukprot:6384879-Amphidinium_carterae.1
MNIKGSTTQEMEASLAKLEGAEIKFGPKLYTGIVKKRIALLVAERKHADLLLVACPWASETFAWRTPKVAALPTT